MLYKEGINYVIVDFVGFNDEFKNNKTFIDGENSLSVAVLNITYLIGS